ncbi:hypothetical protein Pyrfu_0034 [Pyrolobus fumarii 1A]|uniref:Uncharacterized protein n=1 Tax=Pyrolobus fumarii (strain DSM 11204 / 1A) TaxID=694429 RepID=G0EDZ0_PYRF1|nr:hypothetical protein [Pyrolobus fumarii]AEM37906.1 hypothetical protein Pyrfu_0034 [Pyrolobus fumarii 1A]
MRFTPRKPERLADELRRHLLYCNVKDAIFASLQTLSAFNSDCLRLALAFSWAAGLDALLEKPPAAGGLYGKPDLTPIDLASVPGLVWQTTMASCSLGLSPATPAGLALAPALATVSLQPRGNAAQGVLAALSLIAFALPRADWRTDRVPGALLHIMEGDDGLGSALFYATLVASRPGFLARLSYAGLPDATDPCSPRELIIARKTLATILRIAGETSILWRDFVEGLPRILSLSKLHPLLAYSETFRVYGLESGVARRRSGGATITRWHPRDSWLAGMSGASPGDVADLAVVAAGLAILNTLDNTLLESKS